MEQDDLFEVVVVFESSVGKGKYKLMAFSKALSIPLRNCRKLDQ